MTTFILILIHVHTFLVLRLDRWVVYDSLSVDDPEDGCLISDNRRHSVLLKCSSDTPVCLGIGDEFLHLLHARGKVVKLMLSLTICLMANPLTGIILYFMII